MTSDQASTRVAVNFLNDAWGGTPATDRNLYVNAITYNGTNTNQSTTLMNARTDDVRGLRRHDARS